MEGLALEADALVLLVAGQHEGPMDSFLRDKSLEQRSWKLNGLATRATHDHVAYCAAVVVQIGLRRDVKLKFIPAHKCIAE